MYNIILFVHNYIGLKYQMWKACIAIFFTQIPCDTDHELQTWRMAFDIKSIIHTPVKITVHPLLCHVNNVIPSFDPHHWINPNLTSFKTYIPCYCWSSWGSFHQPLDGSLVNVESQCHLVHSTRTSRTSNAVSVLRSL